MDSSRTLIKLGIQVSPRTVQKYLLANPQGGRWRGDPSQRWMTFVGNHAKAIVACDFLDSVMVYCQARPNASLGPGLPELEEGLPVPLQKRRHQIPKGYRVSAKPILGGLHHESAKEDR